MMMRLDRALSENSTLSRSELKKRILAGQAAVNGCVLTRPEEKLDTERDTLTLAGEEILLGKLYLMLHKPAGVVSATEDKRLPTVLDLVPQRWRRKNLFPAGRLDQDTEGFVLLTDDGEFAHRILSPRRHVPKTYFATLAGSLPTDAPRRFLQGVALSDGTLCRPARLEVLACQGERTDVRVILTQGMYHQIKRMALALGCEVVYLKREKIGGLALDAALPLGECRKISREELALIESGEPLC